jgi:CRP-like cAMP-binding protein
VFVIERGWVLITSLAPGGREIVLGLRGPGDLIGDLSALDGAPRSATALALAAHAGMYRAWPAKRCHSR